MSTKVYYAAPLFSNMELLYNEYLVREIRQEFPNVDLYVPQEQGDINDKSQYADSMAIAKYDTDALLSSDLLIAILDGPTIDVGVATEIGVAYQAGIPILALYTDTRQQGADNQEKIEALQKLAESQFSYINLYTVGLIKMNGKIYDNEEDLTQAIEDYI